VVLFYCCLFTSGFSQYNLVNLNMYAQVSPPNHHPIGWFGCVLESKTPGWLFQDPTTIPSKIPGDLIPTIRGSGDQIPTIRGSGAHPPQGVCLLLQYWCVFITAVPITKLFAWGGDRAGVCGRVCVFMTAVPCVCLLLQYLLQKIIMIPNH
jgi:hypothetical protein